MAKRDPEIEATEETPVEASEPTVGERLRAAREKMKLSLDDIAAQTRIPRRHLESIETADWDALPAPTYTTGFAKSYAGAVGLDRTDIGDQLRVEMGGQRFTANAMETFEPADPRRTMPKWLVIGTVVGLIVLVALMSWLNNRSLEQTDEGNNTTVAAAPATAPAAQQAQPAAAPATNSAVVLTATDAAWMQVYEKDGATLFSGVLQGGQTFTVPPQAKAVMLKTAKPEALRITVDGKVVPPVGPAAKKVTVSLLPADLMKGPNAAAAATPAPMPPAAAAKKPAPRRKASPPAAAPAPAPAPAETPPTTNAAG
jgi:cytoskeleton protein RodZ